MRSRGNDLFRVTMMRPARNMPEVASPSEIERGWGEQKRSSAGTCWGGGISMMMI